MTKPEVLSGAAVGSISPTATLPLAGRGGADRLAPPASDVLEVDVISLNQSGRRVILASVDTLFCSSALVSAVKMLLADRKFDLGQFTLLFYASHTHNAPSLDPGKPLLGKLDPEYFGHSASSVADAIERALQTEKVPHTILRGASTCEANARRRRKTLRIKRGWPFISYEMFTLPSHAEDVPRELLFFSAKDRDGTLLWAIWSWACHATSFPHSNVVSPDFPGEVRKRIRAHLSSPNLPVVYIPGLAGDLRSDATRQPVPLLRRMMAPFARPFADQTPENFEVLCSSVSRSCNAAIADAQPVEIKDDTFRIATSQVPLRDLMIGTTHPGAVDLTLFRCGVFSILSLGAEACSPWQAVLSPELPKGTMITGYCNDVPCYLPTDSQRAEGGYEVDGFRHSFGVDGRFASNLNRVLESATRKLVQETGGLPADL